MIASSGLLISCEMELARRPTAASFSLCTRAASALFRWVISSQAAVIAGHVAVLAIDGEVVDIPNAMVAGPRGEFAFDDLVADGLAVES